MHILNVDIQIDQLLLPEGTGSCCSLFNGDTTARCGSEKRKSRLNPTATILRLLRQNKLIATRQTSKKTHLDLLTGLALSPGPAAAH